MVNTMLHENNIIDYINAIFWIRNEVIEREVVLFLKSEDVTNSLTKSEIIKKGSFEYFYGTKYFLWEDCRVLRFDLILKDAKFSTFSYDRLYSSS